MNVIRRSQMIGLTAMDRSIAKGYGRVEEVWVDEAGRVSYFTSDQGYMPLEAVATVGPDAVLTNGQPQAPSSHGGVRLTYSSIGIDDPGDPINPLIRRVVRTRNSNEPVGWIDDFLFDWETGDIVAYVLGGDIASPFASRAVLFPEDVEAIDTDAVVIKDDATYRVKSEPEGLKGFLSEKSQQVKNLVKQMRDRLQSLINPDDDPETVRVKVKQVKGELASSGKHDSNALDEAADYLQDKWQDLQHRVTQAGTRMKKALENAWKRLTK
ncbi:MAG: photosystem reaction center subunit H [Cyanobacteria bacterium SW_9_44_58]|nr:MAG: photosystem reaction center subunit H [Cyanobacteria bacterium SW_9_44_58]